MLAGTGELCTAVVASHIWKVRLYSIASSRYGDDMTGQTTTLCVRRATYWCPELKADDPYALPKRPLPKRLLPKRLLPNLQPEPQLGCTQPTPFSPPNPSVKSLSEIPQ